MHTKTVNGIPCRASNGAYSLSISGDIANTANANYMRPNLVGNPSLPEPTPTRWFNTAAFASPAQFTFGNVGRNTMRSDWVRNFDLSVFRRFSVRERTAVELRAEAFNAFNTPLFGAPNASMSSSNFGRVLSLANTPRQLQLSMKVVF